MEANDSFRVVTLMSEKNLRDLIDRLEDTGISVSYETRIVDGEHVTTISATKD